jgi:hypothetical protein
MNTPAFIFDLLNNELQQIQIKMLEKISKKYNIDINELKNEFIKPLSIIPEKTEKVIIMKKQKGRKLPSDEERCTARIWNRGKGGQCSRPRKKNECFCCQHVENRKHGIISEPPSKKVFKHNTNIVYK